MQLVSHTNCDKAQNHRSAHPCTDCPSPQATHTQVFQGDRVGLCVTQLDPQLVERGVVCAPGSVPTYSGAVASVEKIRFFSGQVRTGGRMGQAARWPAQWQLQQRRRGAGGVPERQLRQEAREWAE